MAVLEVRNLELAFGDVRVLRGVSFEVEAGQTLGVVGESGCGKSMTGLAVMGMTPAGGRVSGSIRLAGRELVGLKEREWQQIRGQEAAMVMQDPFASLNPVMRVGDQIAEVLVLHRGQTWRSARQQAVELLGKVGVPSPSTTARKFPHQMSGGQRQRVVIAAAFACRPKVLIADEPTTALDVTLQAQILRLLKQMQREDQTAVVLVSHDIGVIGSVSDRIAVLYAGRIVETGPVEQVLRKPLHPYTRALLDAMPRAGADRVRAIGGQPPDFARLPVGCSFQTRCPDRFEKCDQDPALFETAPGCGAACWLHAAPAMEGTKPLG